MPFSPIAIVGQGCVLPGALNAREYWNLLQAGNTAIRPAHAGTWRLEHSRILSSRFGQPESTVTDHGGYVDGFESVFDASGFTISDREIRRQEPVLQWLLECSRQSLATCQHSQISSCRKSIIVGNLGYPTAAQSQFAEQVWLRSSGISVAPDCSTVPARDANVAQFVAQCLGVAGDSFTIDAACASSIYAISLACRALQDHRVDLVLAGGANNSDDLFLHVGFTTLRALSPTGYCRPFSEQADGLIPAHGAALVALKRLDDAIETGESILGIIRGIGLSNDGRVGGFLSPSQAGQSRAIRSAYRSAGLRPQDVQYVECHATGTMIGDGVELAALREVFRDNTDLRIGSHKGNIGHAITAAGAAGLLKLLGMFQQKAFVPSVPAENLRSDARITPLCVCDHNETWDATVPRRAGLSAFGFGGANAHLIVEEPPASPKSMRNHVSVPSDISAQPIEIAIVGASVLCGESDSWDEFMHLSGTPSIESVPNVMSSIHVSSRNPGFPPRDLAETLPQQVALMAAIDAAVAGIDLPNGQTGVFIGTDVQYEICRYGARWRLPDLSKQLGSAVGEDWVRAAQSALVSALAPAGVTGTMPNIAAHRINVKHDLQGAGFTISAAKLSGIRALQIAVDGLRHHELDAAIVGAGDLCCDRVHESQSDADQQPGDAVIAFVLKRYADAQAANDPILGLINIQNVVVTGGDCDQANQFAQDEIRFGNCGAASGLLHVAADWARAEVKRLNHVVRTVLQVDTDSAVKVEFTPVGKLAGQLINEEASASISFPAHLSRVVYPPLPQIAKATPQAPVTETRSKSRPGHLLQPPLPAVSDLHQQYISELANCHQLFLNGRAAAMNELLSRRRHKVGPAVPKTARIRQTAGSDASRIEQRPTSHLIVSDQPTPTVAHLESNADLSVRCRIPKGPQFSRSELEVLAGGCISEVFGPLFRQQDSYRRQVRLPMPPLLLVDRVTGIDAEPGHHGTGTIWTETDVCWDSWYLHEGTMPAGIMIESGQADLLLISWMGADFLNRDERVYRLLGCEATFCGSLPRAGETLRYQITIDGHARQGDVRLFFFHYDCYVDDQLRLRVRHGQAGFFTDQELKNTDGILWTADSRKLSEAHIDPPAIQCAFHRFSQPQLEAFYSGNLTACFGSEFDSLKTHIRTPKISGPSLKLIHEVTHFDPNGGPWKRGYLCAELPIQADDWFFAGHFLNDPCMPGTLMLEACLHAMSFYLTALGFTAPHDGWQFEPVADVPVTMQCRGQVTPLSKLLSIEILVEEVYAAPEPTLFADLLCTVDGVKAYYARRMGLRLVPGWPITSQELPAADSRGICKGDLRGDYSAFLECAWGRPSAAFGPNYIPFDRYRRTPRLPSPPYHFISRATRIDAEPDHVLPGAEVAVEYDVPGEAWYFDTSSRPTMPIAVLMEVMLQPCGWLAMMSGVVLKARQELYFRNLDGNGAVYEVVTPESGRLTTTVRLLRMSTVGDTTIVAFRAVCSAGDRLIAEVETSFGFFTRASLALQVGLPSKPDEQSQIVCYRDSSRDADRWVDQRTPPMLRMSDRICSYSRCGGRNNLGHIHAEQLVDRSAWYFKAHFYQDPVQPGSLGVQALINLLIEWLRRSVGDEFLAPHFEPVACGEAMTWSYRGQVLPDAERVHQCVDIVELKREVASLVAVAEGTLWVDGLCIYRLPRFAVRIAETMQTQDHGLVYERVVDLDQEPWWKDHSPTYAVPAMPLMGIANDLAKAAVHWFPALTVVGIRNILLNRWLTLAAPTRLRMVGKLIESLPVDDSRSIRIELSAGAADDLKAVATGTVLLANQYERSEPLNVDMEGLVEQQNPYADASLFHGPAFQLLRRLWSATGRSIAELDLDQCQIPTHPLHPALLDAALHGLPHSDWSRWIPETMPGLVGYPVQLESVDFWGPPPTSGKATVEARLVSSNAITKLHSVELQIVHNNTVWAKIRIMERLFPMGQFGENSMSRLREFIRDHAFRKGVTLSRRIGTTTQLATSDVAAVNWLPGTVEHIYGLRGSQVDLAVQIAVREHVADEWEVHPSLIQWIPASSTVQLDSGPMRAQRVSVTCDGPLVTVRSL